MTAFAILRSDTTVIGRWLWTVDKTLLALLLLLMGVGFLLLFAASPAVAEGHGLSPYYFVMKQGILLPIALLILVGTSLLTPKGVREYSRVYAAGIRICEADARGCERVDVCRMGKESGVSWASGGASALCAGGGADYFTA